MDRKSIGRLAEDVASRYLKQHGYRMLERNFFCRLGELDIVAQQKKVIVFVEVRSARYPFFHDPLDSINPKKISHLKTAAQVWLLKRGIENQMLRFDIIIVMFNQGEIKINHYKDAF